MKQWRYSDEERNNQELFMGCYDCKLPYSSIAWVDVVIPDEFWELINPTEHPGGGLLCFNCICARLEICGVHWNVPFQITSGPFSFSCTRTNR